VPSLAQCPNCERRQWLPRKIAAAAAGPLTGEAGRGAAYNWAGAMRSGHVRASGEDDGGDDDGCCEKAADHLKIS
jgi:hypothetical protein